MKTLAYALVCSIVGALAGCTIVCFAARSWTTFSSQWLTLAALLPIGGTCAGTWIARRKHEKGAFPVEEKSLRLALCLLAAVIGFVACYVAFATVSLIWNQVDVASQGGLLAILLDPAKIPALQKTGASGRGLSMGVFEQAGVGSFASLFATWTVTGRKY